MTHIIDVWVWGENDGGLCLICSTKEDKSDKFLLAKKVIIEPKKYRASKLNTFDLTDFGWKSHRQLCGDEIFEKEKARRAEWKKNK